MRNPARPTARLFALSVNLIALLCFGQNTEYPKTREKSRAMLRPEVLVVTASVVDAQWPNSTNLVNIPADLDHIEPAQCVNVLVIASGDDRDALLRQSQFSFEVEFAGNVARYPAANARATKAVKLEGGDFVTEALGVAGIKNPLSTLVSAAATQARWCAPTDLGDGALKITGKATYGQGESVKFSARSLAVKTFESARRKPPFKSAEEVGMWIQRYHFAPDPALLLPAIRIAAADEKMKAMPTMGIFFAAALRASPAAAKELLRKLPSEQHGILLYALPILAEAGYDTADFAANLPAAEAALVKAKKYPSAFDATPNEGLMNRLDMLWATFLATGEIEPVRAVTGFLAWRDDYQSLKRLIDAGQQPKEANESVMRAVIYRGAGWSLQSLTRSDGLVADYVDFLRASSETAPAVKAELVGLSTNQAFDMSSWGRKSSTDSPQPQAPKRQGDPEPPGLSVRIDFLNPKHSRIAIDARIGPSECSMNPMLHTQTLNGDAGWVLTAFAGEHERLCYRLRSLGNEEWGPWREVKRHIDGQREGYQVSIP